MNGLIQWLAPTMLVAIIALRLPTYRDRPNTRTFTNLLMLLAGFSLLQIEPIAYGQIDPRFHTLTSVWGISGLVAWLLLTAALWNGLTLVLRVAGHQLSMRRVVAGTLILWTILIVTFMLSPAPDIEAPTEPLRATGPLAVFWAAILATTAATPIVCLFYLRRVWRLVENGPIRTVLIAVAGTCWSLILWCVHKVSFFVLDDLGFTNWYTDHTILISRSLLSLTALLFCCVAVIYARTQLPERLRRYRQIRQLTMHWHAVTPKSNAVLETGLIPRTRHAAWQASRNPLAAHRMMIEILDAGVTP
ncbi:hypothetical protein [Antrihabitans stalactiti]|jgi:hypothetical protein|uniref:Integral membrane protein n=1 Tax=Antrihabitans stalactiti TaxID=2584121 RepID=A0A848KM29_9NOCA|nr:hypothetical protein [Antrihabitans stalactiti]NMN99299.1 hypothetical protein [Antrihabitans stalactiti]